MLGVFPGSFAPPTRAWTARCRKHPIFDRRLLLLLCSCREAKPIVLKIAGLSNVQGDPVAESFDALHRVLDRAQAVPLIEIVTLSRKMLGSEFVSP